MENIRKNQVETLEIRNAVTEMENTYDGLISRLDMTGLSLSELGDKSGETFQTEMQREKRTNKREQKNYNCRIITKVVTYMSWEYKGEGKEKKCLK